MDGSPEIGMDYEDPGDTTCSLCFAEFLDLDDLKIHINQVHRTPAFVKCQFCDSECNDMDRYASHIVDAHLVCLKTCKYCTRMFLNADNCRTHEHKHFINTSTRKYSCSQCIAVFSSIPELEYHEYDKHKDIGDGVLLQECFPYLSSVLNINALKFIQSYGTDTVYVCVHCELTTPDVMEYIEHLKRSKCRSYVCDKCSFVYKKKFGLIKHFYTRKECNNYTMKIPKKKCEDCQVYFTPKLLKEHKKNCKALKCKVCNWTFNSMYELTSHQTEFHPLSISLQSCKFCNKEFVGTVALNKHIHRSHKDAAHLYKYSCVHCNAIFNHPKKLFCHFFTKHKNLEPYTCKICNERFKLRKKFTLHIKLLHESVGYVEFDENLHVFFTDKKPEKSFKPTANVEHMAVSEDLDNTDNRDEPSQAATERKRVTFDVTIKETVNLDNVCSDFMDATETEGQQTEGNQTDIEVPKPGLTRKRKLKSTKKNQKLKNQVVNLDSDSSDDEPLLVVRKRVRKKRQQKLRCATWNTKRQVVKATDTKRFTCNICNKYCYTYNNFHNHVNSHSKSENKRCIKCFKQFNSKEKLKSHMERQHSSSRLTETLKKLIEKRKKGLGAEEVQIPAAERFRKTIKKVNIERDCNAATIKPIEDGLSVQKFIESFTPEVNEGPKKEIVIDTVVSIKPVTDNTVKQPLIKLTKFEQNTNSHLRVNFNTKLAMPVKFKPDLGEKQKVTIKIVPEASYNTYPNDDTGVTGDTSFYDDDGGQNDDIPEVAQEVMLEGSEELKSVQVPHKIVLPNILNLPEQCKDVRIAHLLPQAPYYKIVKVKDLLKEQNQKANDEVDKPKESIKLPDGTKLVNVNPLAHLLGDTPVEKVFEKNKSKYNFKPRDFETAIAKAMLKLDKPVVNNKKKGKTKNYANEQ
ncbi:PR domain zinc finger protein 15-like [Galleria mellonella]|uniref:PR domain zinc finger protein 15-like n=1 Tax=Galleria mellonella TaxID=7137 RepID=A0A6J1WIB0_GALME|nr:PR domain zinc finger protein 15-like [Galleria mellonella]